MMESYSGSCLCKSIQYTIESDVVTTANCHCNTCKKSTGAAFQTVTVAQKESFKIKSGAESIQTFAISDNAVKHFCGVCGTPIYNTHQGFPGFNMVFVGSLDEPCQLPPTTNFFCERMLPWVNTIAELENIDRLRKQD
ncbi:MAG: GFA family protein [Desulfofustis sp.]